jgi:hypothetical protein
MAAGSASDIQPKHGITTPNRECAVVLPEGAFKQIKPGDDGSLMGQIIITNFPNAGDAVQGSCSIYNNHIKKVPNGK